MTHQESWKEGFDAALVAVCRALDRVEWQLSAEAAEIEDAAWMESETRREVEA